MNYEEAIESVKHGNKVSRKSWLKPAGSTMGGKTKALMLVSDAKAPYRGVGQIGIEPFVAQCIIGGAIHAYVPTHEDKTAKDWQVL